MIRNLQRLVTPSLKRPFSKGLMIPSNFYLFSENQKDSDNKALPKKGFLHHLKKSNNPTQTINNTTPQTS